MTDKTPAGPNDWPEPDYRLNCRQCGAHFSGPKRAPSCWQCYNPRSILPEEKGAIKAAEASYDELLKRCNDTLLEPLALLEGYPKQIALFHAIQALRASREPVGVRPEDAPLGIRFKFVDRAVIYTLREDDDHKRYAIPVDLSFPLFEIPEGYDRIIPIEEEAGEECEHEREVNTVSGKICPDCDIALP